MRQIEVIKDGSAYLSKLGFCIFIFVLVWVQYEGKPSIGLPNVRRCSILDGE